MSDPICVLLLPAPLERFILRDQAEDLLRADGVVAVDPPRAGYGTSVRLPGPLADGLAARQGRRLLRALRRGPGAPGVVVIFHAVQYPVARAVVALAGDGCELWYWRWDRYEHAYDASPGRRRRLERLHTLAAERAAQTIAVSDELVRLERAEGREATLVPLAADSFPAPDVGGEVVAISIGHLGWRTDWALLRAVAERLGDRLVLLLAGAFHPDECKDDPDFAWCRAAPQLVWLGRRRGAGRGAAGADAPTSASSRSRSSRSTTPDSPTASSSTPAWAAAPSAPSWRACARGTAR